MANTIRAGRIHGDPLCGLCERVCIEVPRIFDGCRENLYNRDVTLTVEGISPQATEPFVFVEAVSSGDTQWVTQSMTAVSGNTYRFNGEAIMPIAVTLTDAYGVAYTGRSSLRLAREFTLTVPEESLVPYRIEVFGAFRSRVGSFTDRTTLVATACIVLIAKVVVPTDLLVPTYGACVYPECRSGQSTCRALFGLPLFPQG